MEIHTFSHDDVDVNNSADVELKSFSFDVERDLEL